MSRRKYQIEAYFQQGQRLHAAGRLAEADRVYRQILATEPRHADSLHMLGLIGLQIGQPQTALAWLDQALAMKPTSAAYLTRRASALLALRRPQEAVAACQEALKYKRNSAEALMVLGHAYSDLGQPDAAVTAYAEAARQNASLPDVHNNLGLALREANRLEDAVAALQEAARRAPGDTLVQGNLAGLLKDLGRLPEAEVIYRSILQREPDNATAHFNLGVLLLLAGRFAEAWPEWEWRFRADPGNARPFTHPLWRGEPLAGRTLLVQGEQGIGDMLQFCRYLPLLPRDCSVVLEVHAPLVRLLCQLPGVGRVVAMGDPLPQCDVCVPMMSLPLYLGIDREAAIPSDVPYLRAAPEAVAGWRARIAGLPGLRVGLVWAGNPDRMRMDQRRSIAPERLAPLAQVPGVSLVSLQKGAAAAALRTTPLAGAVHDWTGELTDFADTAALVEALDLVIGVDTAVVHLAGALAKPVWLLNRADTCWRWLLGRDDSPWYPTLRQFRQSRAGAWEDVILRVREALAEHAAQHAAREVTA